MVRWVRVCIVLMVLLSAGTAWAQQGTGSSASRAAAEALFDQGRKLMGEQKYAEACDKLEASHKLDPGVGTLLYLGDCYEKAGKLASSWAAFEEAASLGTTRGEMDRVKVAQVRASALKPRIPMLVLVVDQPVPGLEVRRDGALVPQASWGSPLPVDAGQTVVMVSAPGYQRWEQTITVPTNLKEPWPVRIPALQTEGPATPAPAAQPTPAPPVQDTSPSNDGSGQRTAGLLVGGVGAVALIASGVLTLMASSKKASSEDNCSPSAPNQCNPVGVADRDDATNLANIATVAGIAGGALLAGGAVVYFTAPRSDSSVGDSSVPQGLVINLKGTF